jgi:hypothetical protein
MDARRAGRLARLRSGGGGIHVADRARCALILAGSLAGSLSGALAVLAVVITGAKRW